MIVYVIFADTTRSFLDANYPYKSDYVHRRVYCEPNITKHQKNIETALEKYILPRIKHYELLLVFATKEEAVICESKLNSKMNFTQDRFPIITAFVDAEKIRSVPVNDLRHKRESLSEDLQNYFCRILNVVTGPPGFNREKGFIYSESKEEIRVVSGKDILPITIQVDEQFVFNISNKYAKYCKQSSVPEIISLYKMGFLRNRTHTAHWNVLQKLLSTEKNETSLVMRNQIFEDLATIKNPKGDYYGMLLATLSFMDKSNILKSEIFLATAIQKVLIDIILEFLIEPVQTPSCWVKTLR